MKFLLRVLLKTGLLFVALNLLVALLDLPGLSRVSIYNGLVPGRPRLPFGESPREAYNFSLFDLDAMFAAHEIDGAGARRGDEFRVVVLGDSSMWGTLLRPEQTLAGQLNALGLTAPDGRPARFYNLGYPTLSLTKDLLILDEARQYAPDLVIWAVTLEAFPMDKQLAVPLVQNNLPRARRVLAAYPGVDLPLPAAGGADFWSRTLVGRRKALADGLRLQIYGLAWAATGVDQAYPTSYPAAAVDLEPDPLYHGQEDLDPASLNLAALSAARKALGDVPLLVVNEPILISAGENSQIRYNFYYPRRAYDQYRQVLAQAAGADGYHYLDAWDIVPAQEFTNSAIHLDQQGTARLARAVQTGLAEWLR